MRFMRRVTRSEMLVGVLRRDTHYSTEGVHPLFVVYFDLISDIKAYRRCEGGGSSSCDSIGCWGSFVYIYTTLLSTMHLVSSVSISFSRLV